MNNPGIKSLIYIFALLFTGCIGNQQKHKSDEAGSLEEIASPALLREIDAFLDGRQTDDSLKVVLLNIHDSLIYISPSVYYDYHESAGYSFYKGKLVGFYFSNPIRNWNFVDTARLEKGAAKGYLDEFPASNPAFDSLEYKYDYRVRTYQIHTKDSLELIFWGYY
ncbi:MAG: hypothetical protein LBV72_16715 [Tannerella sp.]|jgi:hypothetical protein|nr:hypothetical protein [Tannerella sp.]